MSREDGNSKNCRQHANGHSSARDNLEVEEILLELLDGSHLLLRRDAALRVLRALHVGHCQESVSSAEIDMEAEATYLEITSAVFCDQGYETRNIY